MRDLLLKVIIFSFIMVSWPFYADAGGGQEGHGGSAMVCRDSLGQIIREKTELYDLFEGSVEADLKFDRATSLSVEELLAKATARLEFSPQLQGYFKGHLGRVKKSVSVNPEALGLAPMTDIDASFVKKGCMIETVAIYKRTGKILLDPEIFNSLNRLDQAALFAHEALYAMARRISHVTTSRSTRELTSQLFAENPDFEIIRKNIATYLTDQGTGVYVGHVDPQWSESLKLKITVSNKKDMLWLIGAHFKTPEMVSLVNPTGYFGGQLIEKVLAGNVIELPLPGPASDWIDRSVQLAFQHWRFSGGPYKFRVQAVYGGSEIPVATAAFEYDRKGKLVSGAYARDGRMIITFR